MLCQELKSINNVNIWDTLLKNFFLLETVDIGGALYVYSLGGVFALSIGVILFCSTKFRQKAQIYENYNR